MERFQPQLEDDETLNFMVIPPKERKGIVQKFLKSGRPLSCVIGEREENFISLKYGLNDGIPRTLQKIAQEHGITRQRVDQIIYHAIKKLKRAM